MRFLTAAFLFASFALAQMKISVSNGATGRGQIAPGSLVDIFWDPRAVADVLPIPGVRISSQGQIFNAQVLSSEPGGWIRAVIPENVPTGAALLTLTLNPSTIQAATILVTPFAPGIFTLSNYSGPAKAQNILPDGSAERNALTTPAKPRQFVTLWGTGFGVFQNVRVSIGGQTVLPSYAGRAPGLAGVDQINFQIPDEIVSSCYVPLTVTSGGIVSNSATISVDRSTGACVHPLGLFSEEEHRLDLGDTILAGELTFSAAVVPSTPGASNYTRLEGFSASFQLQAASSIFFLARAQIAIPEEPVCTVLANSDALSAIVVAGGAGLSSAGPTMTLVSPEGRRFDVLYGIQYALGFPIPAAVPSESQLPPPAFSPGWWTIGAAGGDKIKAFSERYLVPPEIRWTNRDSLASFTRDSDLPITWDPAGYENSDRMIAGVFTSGASFITCSSPARAGRIVIPRALMRQIGPAAAGMLTLILQRPAPWVFRVDLNPRGSAPAVITFTYNDFLTPIVR